MQRTFLKSKVSDAAQGRSFATQSNPQYEALRQLLLRKNELYFHRWRPQNITYLFGFRKHEQGNNAADIAKFDPFILELEKQIHELQQPRVASGDFAIAVTPCGLGRVAYGMGTLTELRFPQTATALPRPRRISRK